MTCIRHVLTVDPSLWSHSLSGPPTVIPICDRFVNNGGGSIIQDEDFSHLLKRLVHVMVVYRTAVQLQHEAIRGASFGRRHVPSNGLRVSVQPNSATSFSMAAQPSGVILPSTPLIMNHGLPAVAVEKNII